MSPSKDKKQKVIHTRVSEPLDRALREKAEVLGVSVSTMVRNLLTNTVDLVEEIVVDSARVADSARGAVRPGPASAAWPPLHPQEPVGQAAPQPVAPTGPTPAPTIMGWHTFRLARNALCSQCNDILPKGTRAAVSVLDGPGPRVIICRKCRDRVCPRVEDPSEPSAAHQE